MKPRINLSPAFLAALLVVVLTGCAHDDWRTASRESASLAPDPVATREAVLQVYGADAFSWRGTIAIHTWIAVKRTNEQYYTVYDVVGWRERSGKDVMQIQQDIPDRYWYGAMPKVLKEFRGKGTDALIAKVDQAARNYPWKHEYAAFPGPNSNTFVGWIGRQVPELELELPFSAIGSGYDD